MLILFELIQIQKHSLVSIFHFDLHVSERRNKFLKYKLVIIEYKHEPKKGHLPIFRDPRIRRRHG
jgi:hypothetical protein